MDQSEPVSWHHSESTALNVARLRMSERVLSLEALMEENARQGTGMYSTQTVTARNRLYQAFSKAQLTDVCSKIHALFGMRMKMSSGKSRV